MNLQQSYPITNNYKFLPDHEISTRCLYPGFSRVKVSELPVKLAATMLSDAINLDRYYNEFININGQVVSEGANSCKGPEGFDQSVLDDSPIGSISYETHLILPWLSRMNESLSTHNIRTVQSQPAYYNNEMDPSFESYFQIPFVDFEGTVDSIKIFRQMETDERLSNCFFDIFYTECKKTKQIKIRFCIMRPFVNFAGEFVSEFSDRNFWKLVCSVCEDLSY